MIQTLPVEVQAAIISGGFVLIAALIPCLVVIVGVFIALRNNKRYLRTSVHAMREIRVLKARIAKYEELSGIKANEVAIKVRAESGLFSSQKFTPQRLEIRLAAYEKKLDEPLPTELM